MAEIFGLPFEGDEAGRLLVPNKAHAAINRYKEQLTSETVMANLHRHDPAIWGAWCGEDGKGKPHLITPGEFARLFGDWHIHAKPKWSRGPKADRTCARGRRYEDFTARVPANSFVE
jgi:hypothetical protein